MCYIIQVFAATVSFFFHFYVHIPQLFSGLWTVLSFETMPASKCTCLIAFIIRAFLLLHRDRGDFMNFTASREQTVLMSPWGHWSERKRKLMKYPHFRAWHPVNTRHFYTTFVFKTTDLPQSLLLSTMDKLSHCTNQSLHIGRSTKAHTQLYICTGRRICMQRWESIRYGKPIRHVSNVLSWNRMKSRLLKQ